MLATFRFFAFSHKLGQTATWQQVRATANDITTDPLLGDFHGYRTAYTNRKDDVTVVSIFDPLAA
jgi:hypothetical protein